MTAPTIGSYTDFHQFASLRSAAGQNDPAAIREVASQFEALFVQMMMKNMRDTSLAEPVFGQSDQHDMYQDMMDKQLSLEMASGKGIGLAEMLVRQLGGEVAEKPRNPGYASVRNHPGNAGGFAKALQSTGYAADPVVTDRLTGMAPGDTMKQVLRGLKTDESQPINSRLEMEAI